MKKFIVGIVAVCAIAFGGQALAQETLTVWWVKGFYKSDDDALFRSADRRTPGCLNIPFTARVVPSTRRPS